LLARGLKLRVIKEAKFISRVRRKTNTGKIVLVILILLILQFLAIEGLIIFNGQSDAEVYTEYLLIPGAGLNGNSVSECLKSRLDAGLDYLKKYPDVIVVVSGGRESSGDITEAEAMRDYLMAEGIDESRILLEPNATSTMENFRFAKELIEKKTGKPVSDITFATNNFHVLRAKMLAGRNNLNAHAINADTGYARPIFYIKEYFALIKSFILDR